MEIWIPAVVAVVTLIINICFNFIISPMIIRKYEVKTKLFDICQEFLIYLTDVVSFDNFDHVPSTVRNYSLKIHVCFKTGEAPKQLKEVLEKLFQAVKERHDNECSDIKKWKEEFRNLVKEFRRQISKYVGVF